MGTLPQVAHTDHHYVPKFYLKGFTDKNKSLWVYEFGQNAPRESDPKREGHRENYYTFADRGYPDDSAEKILSKAESVVAPTIRKLANPQFKTNERQISELFTFVAMMFVRVPAYREFINDSLGKLMKEHARERARDKDSFLRLIDEYEKQNGKLIADREKLWKFAISDEYTVTQESVGYNLMITFRSGFEMAILFEAEYKHDIYYSPPDSYFMTCDNPIATLEPDEKGRAYLGVGVGRPRTEVIFPLNKRACLVMSRRGLGASIAATTQMVDQVNAAIMSVAQRYVYAPSDIAASRAFSPNAGAKPSTGSTR